MNASPITAFEKIFVKVHDVSPGYLSVSRSSVKFTGQVIVVGRIEGSALGMILGYMLGPSLGTRLGVEVGSALGSKLGIAALGSKLGIAALGSKLGIAALDSKLGIAALGSKLGIAALGSKLGIALGSKLGIAPGSKLGITLLCERRNIPRDDNSSSEGGENVEEDEEVSRSDSISTSICAFKSELSFRYCMFFTDKNEIPAINKRIRTTAKPTYLILFNLIIIFNCNLSNHSKYNKKKNRDCSFDFRRQIHYYFTQTIFFKSVVKILLNFFLITAMTMNF